jgi:hypothetical protein
MDRRTVLLGSLGFAVPATSSELQQGNQKRYALILANQSYEKNPLPNIRNDALLMDKTLKSIGFTTSVVLDGTRISMLDGIRRFKSSLSPGSFVLVYYSGHGAQVDGENYLIPTDNGQIEDSDAAKDQCIPLGGSNGLLEKLGRSPAQLNLIILDACRDDPFPAATKSQASKGLAVVARRGTGDYIAMAASPGQTATANPKGINSLYTQELAQRLATPGLRLEDVFIETRNAVVSASGGKQVPQEFGTLMSKVYLAGTWNNGVLISNPEVKIASTSIRLEFKGVPAGVVIKVDGVTISGTVYSDEIADKRKEVEVAISAPGFRPSVSKVTLIRGTVSVFRVDLEPRRIIPGIPTSPSLVSATSKSAIPKFGKMSPSSKKLGAGLEVQELKVGTGAEAKPGTVATLHYTGWNIRGEKYDSSLERNDPYELIIPSPIETYHHKAVLGMKVGGKRRIRMPTDLGWFKQETSPYVMPGATMIYEVELLKVKKKS